MNHTGQPETILPDWRDARIRELEQQAQARLEALLEEQGAHRYTQDMLRACREGTRPEGSVAREIARRALQLGNFDILKAPCMFCAYSGKAYWQTGTHAEGCPVRDVGGMAERADYLRAPQQRSE